jgi:hypothetical protein
VAPVERSVDVFQVTHWLVLIKSFEPDRLAHPNCTTTLKNSIAHNLRSAFRSGSDSSHQSLNPDTQ